MPSLRISSGTKEYIKLASEPLAEAFVSNPIIRYLLSNLGDEEYIAYLPTFFHVLMKAATLNHGTIEEIDDFKSVGAMMPPGYKYARASTNLQAGFGGVVYKLGFSGYQRMAGEFDQLVKKMRINAMGKGVKYYYIFFLGTGVEARCKDNCSQLVRHYQEVARKKNSPIWLEATTKYCMKLYEKLGFEVFEKMTFGVEKVDETGHQCEGGKGVMIWGMIWRPEKQEIQIAVVL